MIRTLCFCLTVVLATSVLYAAEEDTSPDQSPEDQSTDVGTLLRRPILDSTIPLKEMQAYAQSHLLPMPRVSTVQQWEAYAQGLRQQVLERVVLRGKAKEWDRQPLRIEWLESIEGGPGYRIRKLRYEAVPGLWIPALLYEPAELSGPVPVILNVNGHDGNGKSADYKQIRCINEAKRGMLALNVEWLGMGQLKKPNYLHYRMNQIDLCGTSGLAPFYLAMKRGLDVLLSLEHADPDRVAVTGCSGGGWQTIFISSLDPRVTLANPVAGYSGLATRIHYHSDLGDSEQMPTDLATVADYLHLTALRAPRPTLLTYNAADDCCFRADHALPPLLDAAQPVFDLYGKPGHLRSHINHDPGTHNFFLDNRQQFYRMLGDFFYPDDPDFDPTEIPSDDEVKTAEELAVALPEKNADFHSLALALSRNLPCGVERPAQRDAALAWQEEQRGALERVVRAVPYHVRATVYDRHPIDGGQVTLWWLRVGMDWTLPAVELTPPDPTSTVLLVADDGRKSVAAQAQAHLDAGHRVLAVDPFYLGESAITSRPPLFALMVSGVGGRPVGLQASQLAAIARWSAGTLPGKEVRIEAVGPRTGLCGLIAAAIEPHAIHAVALHDSLASLHEVIEQNQTVDKAPELFCFGLLEQFDIEEIAALVAPRRVVHHGPSDRARKKLAGLAQWYALLGEPFDPLAE
jgi:dienelactone hydrolase